MIRQFGVPTFFITLSGAETKWPELIMSLKKIIDNEQITFNEAENFPYLEKLRLIHADPFLCATYFDLRVKELIKTWDYSDGPFGN